MRLMRRQAEAVDGMDRAERLRTGRPCCLQTPDELPVDIGEIGELLLLQRRFLHAAFQAALP